LPRVPSRPTLAADAAGSRGTCKIALLRRLLITIGAVAILAYSLAPFIWILIEPSHSLRHPLRKGAAGEVRLAGCRIDIAGRARRGSVDEGPPNCRQGTTTVLRVRSKAWPAVGLSFEFNGAEIAECGMAAGGVVEPLDCNRTHQPLPGRRAVGFSGGPLFNLDRQQTKRASSVRG
jgi:hypothetical protein